MRRMWPFVGPGFDPNPPILSTDTLLGTLPDTSVATVPPLTTAAKSFALYAIATEPPEETLDNELKLACEAPPETTVALVEAVIPES